MKTFKIDVSFPEANESTLVYIQAKSEQDAIQQIKYDSNKINTSIESIKEIDGLVGISTVYIEPVRVSKEVLSDIYRCLSGSESDDTVISKTAVFPDGVEMDIKACSGVDFEGWTEAVLFNNGCECCCSEVEDAYEGVWGLERKGTQYIAVVIPETGNSFDGVITLADSDLSSAVSLEG